MRTLLLIFGMLLTVTTLVKAQTLTIRGRVIDSDKNPLPGVNVIVKNKSIGAITDLNGKFLIHPVKKGDILLFTYVGYLPEKFEVNDTSFIHVTLKEDVKKLDEVVVIGYGVEKKSTLTGAIATIGSFRRHASHRRFHASISGSKEVSTANDGIHPGMLTAGEVNDFSKWNLWKDIAANELNRYQLEWKIWPEERYTVQLKTSEGFPVVNARVRLVDDNGTEHWAAKSDNTGKAELWDNAFDSLKGNDELSIRIDHNGHSYTIKHAKKFHEGINTLEIPVKYTVSKDVDVAFVVDATGSMSDEISYLKTELSDIMHRTKDAMPKIDFRSGAVFYRDIGDDYVTKKSDFSEDIDKTVKFVQNNNANGGGDFPEAVDQALKVTMEDMHWNDDARSRLVFLVLDAPPHQTDSVINRVKAMTREATEKGIRIIPVTCSGVDKSTEYLMRSLALLTNGTYTFLTDDSGIGDPHLKPTTDKYDVESFNDLVMRLIYQYTHVPPVEQKKIAEKKDTTVIVYKPKDMLSEKDSSQEKASLKRNLFKRHEATEATGLKLYPNPTTGMVTVESGMNLKDIYISDISGKILERQQIEGSARFTLDLSKYPDGIYFICNEYEPDKWIKGKVLLIH